MRTPRSLLGALGAVAIVSGCSGNEHGNPVPVAPIAPSASPTPSAAASATPKPTATPTTAPTATPTAIATSPGTSIQQFCSLSNNSVTGTFPPIPGTYTVLLSEGQLTGSSYAQSLGEYEAIVLASPSPSSTITPMPTATPVATPSPIATGTPAYIYDVYTGGYNVPGYTVTPSASASPGATPLAVEATTGCFLFVQLVQPTPGPTGTPINAEAIGLPYDPNGGPNQVGTGPLGMVPTFSLTTFAPSGGSGSFTLDNGVVGTFAIGPEQTYTANQVKRIKEFYQNRLRPGR